MFRKSERGERPGSFLVQNRGSDQRSRRHPDHRLIWSPVSPPRKPRALQVVRLVKMHMFGKRMESRDGVTD